MKPLIGSLSALAVALVLIFALALPAHAQVLPPSRGGTGTSTNPSLGQVLLGQSNGTYAPVATTSLGIIANISAAYPLQYANGLVSLLFGTTTANSWGAHNIFASLFATNASSTNATSTNLAVTGSFDFLGTVITNVGTWFNGLFDARLATKTTADLAEGANLYFTNDRADARIAAQKGQADGIASLDGGGKVPVSQLPNAIMVYQGTWNANTNTPTLADGVGSTGDVYRVSVAGTQDLGSGAISFVVGDYAIYNGSTWEKADTTDAVSSVNGFTGDVDLDTGDIPEGSNLYYTLARWASALAGTTTDALSEGSANRYYTDARVGSYITGSSTLPALLNYWTKSGSSISYTAGDVVIGSLTGFLKGTSGTVSAVSSIVPGDVSLTKGNFLVGNDAGVAQATSTIFVSSTGNVGIGTTNPLAKLTVGGSQSGNAGMEIIPGSGIVLQSYNRTAGAYASISYDGSSMNFRPNGSSKMFIDTTGVGIGNTAPIGKLHVSGAEDATFALDKSGSTVGRFRMFVGNGTGFTADENYIQNLNTGLHILGGATGLAEYVTVEYTGNVGIGTSTPAAKLGVAGDLYLTGKITATSTATSTFSGAVQASCFSTDGTTCLTTGGGTWGSITGTLSDQTDLQTALDAKESDLTFSYPLTRSANTISLAFGTTTANTWSGLQTFTNVGTTTFSDGIQAATGYVSSLFEAVSGIFTSLLRIPYSAALSLVSNGDIGIDSTSNQFQYRSGGATRVLGNGNFYPAFTYSTSTAPVGTTTQAAGTAFVAETWNAIQCFTDSGTAIVRVTDGTNAMNALTASTTVGTVTLSSNNTFTASEKRYVEIGSWSGSPKQVSCTVSKSLSPD